MPTETLIERAYTLVQMNRVDEARPLLAELFRANQNDSEAWAIAAEIAPTAGTREEALRKVADMSTDTRLAEWAITELSRLKGMATMTVRTAPPLPSVPDSWGASPSVDSWSRSENSTPQRQAVDLPAIAPKPKSERALADEPAFQPEKLRKALPTSNEGAPISTGYIVRVLGGWIMMFAVILLVGALLSEPFNHMLLESANILMGQIAIALAVIGGLVVGVGYALRDD